MAFGGLMRKQNNLFVWEAKQSPFVSAVSVKAPFEVNPGLLCLKQQMVHHSISKRNNHINPNSREYKAAVKTMGEEGRVGDRVDILCHYSAF